MWSPIRGTRSRVDFGLEKRLLTQRSLSPDAGRGADAERKGWEKGGFLIGEEIAHVPKSWDALTRAYAWILDCWRAPEAGGFEVGSLGRGGISEAA